MAMTEYLILLVFFLVAVAGAVSGGLLGFWIIRKRLSLPSENSGTDEDRQ